MSHPDLARLTQVAQSICKSESLKFSQFIDNGAFKSVFLVNSSQNQPLALKVVHTPGKSPRTEREIQALKDCTHPNVCNIFSSGEHTFEGKNYEFSVEEFISGGNLTNYIEKKGLLEWEKASHLLKALSSVLTQLHVLQLVHRDIKPDNILIRDHAFEPVLVDFGLVRDLTATSLTQTWLMRGPGTPYFASPEQLNNEKELIDWRTDQFSLGVLISYVTFGVHPYYHDQDSSQDTVERVATRGAKGSKFLEGVAQYGATVLDKMTEPWPIQRYRLPAGLISALSEDI